MFSQFFGSYLLSHNIVTNEQLVSAIRRLPSAHMKLSTLALYYGLLTLDDIQTILSFQENSESRFGELAVEHGYLSETDVLHLLRTPHPDFLLLGQILVDDGILSNQKLQDLLLDYQSNDEVMELETSDVSDEQKEEIRQFLDRYFSSDAYIASSVAVEYMSLFFNNLIRFIGDDFTVLEPIPLTEYPILHCVSQHISGAYSITMYLDLDEETATGFASRYGDDSYTEYNEFVEASLGDFVNLHNGLFNVNQSNSKSIELTLDPPVMEEEDILFFEKNTFLIPIVYPFGMMHFLVSFESL